MKEDTFDRPIEPFERSKLQKAFALEPRVPMDNTAAQHTPATGTVLLMA